MTLEAFMFEKNFNINKCLRNINSLGKYIQITNLSLVMKNLERKREGKENKISCGRCIISFSRGTYPAVVIFPDKHISNS
jgi:hypothetical protein